MGSNLIKAMLQAEKLREKCKHKHTITYKNTKAYTYIKKCKDCGKILDYKLK